jgi:hypothetical protein
LVTFESAVKLMITVQLLPALSVFGQKSTPMNPVESSPEIDATLKFVNVTIDVPVFVIVVARKANDPAYTVPNARVAGENFSADVAIGFTLSVKLCVPFGEIPLLAVIVIGKLPEAVGVPLRTPAVLRVTPFGSEPVSLNVNVAGNPEAVTVNVPSVPCVNVVEFALVIAGDLLTVNGELPLLPAWMLSLGV